MNQLFGLTGNGRRTIVMLDTMSKKTRPHKLAQLLLCDLALNPFDQAAVIGELKYSNDSFPIRLALRCSKKYHNMQNRWREFHALIEELESLKTNKA